jgi:hypothetical protein
MRRASSFSEQLGRRTASGLVLEIDVAERLPGGVPDDEARRVLVDHPRGREVGALPALVS